jgi:hypothetical protein
MDHTICTHKRVSHHIPEQLKNLPIAPPPPTHSAHHTTCHAHCPNAAAPHQVTATKAALEAALMRLDVQRTAYLPYRDAVLWARGLDVAALAPAFKAGAGSAQLLAIAEAATARLGMYLVVHARQIHDSLLKQPCTSVSDLMCARDGEA